MSVIARRKGESLEDAARRVATDALYTARDNGGTMHDAGAAAGDAVSTIYAGAVSLLATFVDDEPCSLDHHGYCQTHVWLQKGECNVARARRIIGGQ